jgi:putative transcriptional regulator
MAIMKVTPEVVATAVGETDWRAVDAQSDEGIACSVAGDPNTAPIMTDGEIAAAIARGVRKRLGLSQAAFAKRFRVPLGTLRDWEQGRRRPDAPALAYLQVIAREPEVVARALASG